MATRDAGEAPQFPLNTWGPKGEHAVLGSHRFRTWGATGSISATMSAGIPGVTATRITNGQYRIGHPPCPSGIVDVYIEASSPSGTLAANPYIAAQSHAQNQTGQTGFCDFRITQGGNTINPATGTTIKALFYVAPITPY